MPSEQQIQAALHEFTLNPKASERAISAKFGIPSQHSSIAIKAFDLINLHMKILKY
jgi:hypothetical protein